MAALVLTNVLNDAEVIANADKLAQVFAQAAGTNVKALSVQQAHQLADGLKKAGFLLAVPVQKGQL